MHNPLLTPEGLPAFDAIRPEHVAPAIDELLAAASAALEQAVGPDVPADFDALSRVLSVATEQLGRAWGAVSHLSHVADTPELRAAHAAALPKVTEFTVRQGSDERLYAKYRALADSPAAAQLSAPRREALSHWLRDFKLGGADLQGEAKARYAAIQDRMAALSQAFSNHVLDATDAFAHFASAEEVAGLPADWLQASAEAAQAEGREGHRISLHVPSYFPVLQYGSHRPLRELIYRANVTRASEFGPPERDNAPLDGRTAGPAPRRSPVAGLCQLRRGVAGQQDGQQPDRGDGLPA